MTLQVFQTKILVAIVADMIISSCCADNEPQSS